MTMCNVTIGKVNDIKGFFKTYHEMRLENFTNLFGDVPENDIQALDYCLSDIYGSRCLQRRFSDIYSSQSASECMARIVTIADKLYFENWFNTKHAIEKALLTDLDKPLTSEKTGLNTTENKVNAFDSETASDSDNSTHNYSETTRYSNGKTATQNAKTQLDFNRNNDLLEIIMSDILTVCCLSVYDDSYHSCRASGGGETDPELENRVAQCKTDITGIKKLIPISATEQNKLATIADVPSGYDDTELENRVAQCKTDITGIKKLIPISATEQNKLATIADVPSGYDDTELRLKIERNTESIQHIHDSLTVSGSKPFINDFNSPALFGLDDANKGNAGITLVKNSTCKNLPPLDDWYALISTGDRNTSVQVAFSLFNNSLYKRLCASGNWSDWVSLVSDTGWKELTSGIIYRIENGFLTLHVSTQFVPSMNTLKLPFTFSTNHSTFLSWGPSVVGWLVINNDGSLVFNGMAEGASMFCDFTFPVN